MANITITKPDTFIMVDFGAYYPSAIAFSKASYNPIEIIKVYLYSDHIDVRESDGKRWRVKTSTETYSGALIVDTVLGVAPTDLEDLYNKIIALM